MVIHTTIQMEAQLVNMVIHPIILMVPPLARLVILHMVQMVVHLVNMVIHYIILIILQSTMAGKH